MQFKVFLFFFLGLCFRLPSEQLYSWAPNETTSQLRFNLLAVENKLLTAQPSNFFFFFFTSNRIMDNVCFWTRLSWFTVFFNLYRGKIDQVTHTVCVQVSWFQLTAYCPQFRIKQASHTQNDDTIWLLHAHDENILAPTFICPSVKAAPQYNLPTSSNRKNKNTVTPLTCNI